MRAKQGRGNNRRETEQTGGELKVQELSDLKQIETYTPAE